MPANPTIKAVSAIKDATSIVILALLENISRGMVQMRACLTSSCTTITVNNCTTTTNSTTITTSASIATVVIGMKVTGTGIAAGTYVTAIASATSLTINKNATSTGTVTLTFGPEDVAMSTEWCVEPSYSNYIPEMYRLVNASKSKTTSATMASLRAHICNSGEDCDTLACTTWNSSPTSSSTNIDIDNAFGLTPIAVSNLTLTPGDKSISASWGDVNQTTSIWAYEILLEQGATQLASGARVKTVMPISNLINETQYKVSVRAVSFDGYKGPWINKTATPSGASCVNPHCTINITG